MESIHQPGAGNGQSLLRADLARRQATLQAIAAVFAMLTLLVTLQTVFTGRGLAGVLVASGLATLGFGVSFFLASRGRVMEGTWLLVATMLVQHVTTTFGMHDLETVGRVMMFSGLCPLIASATLGPRHTAGVLGLSSVALVTVGAIHVGDMGALTLTVWALGPALFFVLVAGTVGIVAALAAQRSLASQLEQARATEAAEARFALVADQVSDLVALLDEEGRYTFASASFERLLGVQPSELLGRTSPELIHAEDFETLGRAFQVALEQGRSEGVVRMTREGLDGSLFHVRLARVQIDGRPQIALTAHDVTGLQAINAQRESEERMEALERLAAGVAHDFNNLLSVVGTCSAILRDELPSNAGRRDLDDIDVAVSRASELTGQLLAFARSHALPTGACVPSEVIPAIRPLIERAVGDRVELTVTVEGKGKGWPVASSASQLEQILMNLSVNARDAMPEGGTLAITVSQRTLASDEVPGLAEGEQVVVEVRDSGVGMPPDVRARVFEPFFSTKGPGGTGLGLATCFGLTHQLGGTITVESELGQGSTFRVYLPRALEEPAIAPMPMVSETEPRSRRVLVVDDDRSIRELVARTLRGAGNEARVATSTTEALSLATEEAPDVLITDILLGDEDGLDLLEQMRDRLPSAGLVVISGYAPDRDRLERLRASGAVFVAKPFSRETLLTAVAAAAATAT